MDRKAGGKFHPPFPGRFPVLLEKKNAVIYGAGGGIGGGVARAFAGEGARVFLCGRTRSKLDAIARDIAAASGSAEVAVLDATDERAVEEHAQAVAAKAGSLDISFNLISRGLSRTPNELRGRDRRERGKGMG
jgi:NADP-dependent 3-hydroxy acid dehydrogenase YdfG